MTGVCVRRGQAGKARIKGHLQGAQRVLTEDMLQDIGAAGVPSVMGGTAGRFAGRFAPHLSFHGKRIFFGFHYTVSAFVRRFSVPAYLQLHHRARLLHSEHG